MWIVVIYVSMSIGVFEGIPKLTNQNNRLKCIHTSNVSIDRSVLFPIKKSSLPSFAN